MNRRAGAGRAAPYQAGGNPYRPSRARRSVAPGVRRRRRRIMVIGAVIAVIAALVAFRDLTAHADTTFNEIAIQPRPGSQATVGADVAAELRQAVRNGGQLLLSEIAGQATTSPALSVALSCAPGTNQLICNNKIAAARRKASRIAESVVTSPAPAGLDLYAVFSLTSGYLKTHPGHYQAIVLWVNTTGDQLVPVNLAGLTSRSGVAALARHAVAIGAFPGPNGCDGYQVHMVVPPSGSPAHQLALRDLIGTLIAQCGGHLASWTARWIAPDSGVIALPRIPHAIIVMHHHTVSYTLSDKLDDFAVGSAGLTAAAKAALTSIAADIEARAPDRPVTCTGSTDGTGSAAFDLTLSRQRAAVVCGFLAGQGISRSLLRVAGTGKATPTAADPALRRVVITTTTSSG